MEMGMDVIARGPGGILLASAGEPRAGTWCMVSLEQLDYHTTSSTDMAVSQASSVEKQNGSSSSIKSTSFTPTNSKPFTQRFTVVESSSNGRTDPRQSRRLTGDDGDEGGRQQHGAAAGKGKGKQREEEVRDSATAEHFDKNSKTIQARARAEMRDSLIWVTRLSEGPVDRSVLREAVRQSVPVL